jgi:hypothetical protein
MPSENPFASVVVDRGVMVAEQVAALLQGRATIDPVTNTVFVTAENASAKARVVLAFAGRKALAMFPRDEPLHAEAPSESLMPRDVEAVTGLGGGTIRPILKTLLAERVLQKDGGAYVLSIAALDRAAKLLRDGEVL